MFFGEARVDVEVALSRDASHRVGFFIERSTTRAVDSSGVESVYLLELRGALEQLVARVAGTAPTLGPAQTGSRSRF